MCMWQELGIPFLQLTHIHKLFSLIFDSPLRSSNRIEAHAIIVCAVSLLYSVGGSHILLKSECVDCSHVFFFFILFTLEIKITHSTQNKQTLCTVQ